MDAAFELLGEGHFRASQLTGGPWQREHQHAGPASALICRAVESAANPQGFPHVARLTINLLRPLPIGECRIEVAADYLGRNAGHFSGKLIAGGKEAALFTALAQREDDVPVPQGAPGHPLPLAPKPVAECPVVTMSDATGRFGYAISSKTGLRRALSSRGPALCGSA